MLSAGEPTSLLVLKPFAPAVTRRRKDFAPAVTRRSEKIAPASLR